MKKERGAYGITITLTPEEKAIMAKAWGIAENFRELVEEACEEVFSISSTDMPYEDYSYEFTNWAELTSLFASLSEHESFEGVYIKSYK